MTNKKDLLLFVFNICKEEGFSASDMEKLKIRELIDLYWEQIQNETYIYRTLEVKSLDKINWNSIGTCWSSNKNIISPICGTGTTIKLYGKAKKEDIDYYVGVINFLISPYENEIRLLPNRNILIYKYEILCEDGIKNNELITDTMNANTGGKYNDTFDFDFLDKRLKTSDRRIKKINQYAIQTKKTTTFNEFLQHLLNIGFIKVYHGGYGRGEKIKSKTGEAGEAFYVSTSKEEAVKYSQKRHYVIGSVFEYFLIPDNKIIQIDISEFLNNKEVFYFALKNNFYELIIK